MVFAENCANALVNGRRVRLATDPNAVPFVRYDTLLVPLNYVADAFGVETLYVPEKSQIIIRTRTDTAATFTDVDSPLIIINNDKVIQMDLGKGAILNGNTVMVPIQAIAEHVLGKNVTVCKSQSGTAVYISDGKAMMAKLTAADLCRYLN